MKYGNIKEAPEPIRQAALDASLNGDVVDWAALVGLRVTGEAKADDMGFNLFEELRGMETKELHELWYAILHDYFGPTGLPDEPEPGSRDAFFRGLVEVIQAEIGGRWVGVRP